VLHVLVMGVSGNVQVDFHLWVAADVHSIHLLVVS